MPTHPTRKPSSAGRRNKNIHRGGAEDAENKEFITTEYTENTENGRNTVAEIQRSEQSNFSHFRHFKL